MVTFEFFKSKMNNILLNLLLTKIVARDITRRVRGLLAKKNNRNI